MNKNNHYIQERMLKKTSKQKIKKIKKTESIVARLKRENNLNENTEILINNLTLEELIQLKLEISSKMVLFNKFYGYPLWTLFPAITREALLNFALSATTARKDTASFLGITPSKMSNLIKKFEPFIEEKNIIEQQMKR